MHSDAALTPLIDDARGFLRELSENNSRDWFRTHRNRYDAVVKRPAERLIADLTPRLERALDQRLRSKLFRPHRDVRFSPDKTPYHTHLHIAWTGQDGLGWYFGISPSYVTAGAGIMSFDTAQLTTWRAAIDSNAGAVLPQMLAKIGGRLDPPALKRVPQPYASDHPREDLLRRKSLTLWLDDIESAVVQNPTRGLESCFQRLRPVTDWLSVNL